MEFKYANKSEQLLRANRVLLLGYLTYFICIALTMVYFCGKGIRSVGMTSFVCSIILLSVLVLGVVYRRFKASTKLKYVTLPFLLVVSFCVGISFEQGFMQFLGVFPFIASLPSYDKKYLHIGGSFYIGLELFITIAKITQGFNLEADFPLNQIMVFLVVSIVFILLFFVNKVLTQFNNDSIGQVETEKENIEVMMNDVMNVSNEVVAGTVNAMNIVVDLNESTNLVKGAMKDISDSTVSTAENIQIQMSMTANIQHSIEQTISSSGRMVDVAKKSENLNEQSLKFVNHLKDQSHVISETNADVASAMVLLRYVWLFWKW